MKPAVKPTTKKLRKSPIFTFTGIDAQVYKLTDQQKKFAEAFVHLGGNGVEAIIEAGYNCFFPNSKTPNRKLAAVMASENLVRPNIMRYIELIFEDTGLNDAILAKHLLFNVTQFADLGAKNKAIDIAYRLRNKYPKGQAEGAQEVTIHIKND